MNHNPTQIIEFVKSQKTCVLAVVLSENQPHAAAMHFSHSFHSLGEDSSENLEDLQIFFMTQAESLKVKSFESGNACKAAVVIGVEEGPTPSMQMEGNLEKIVDQGLRDQVREHHFGFYPQSRDYEKPDSVFMIFKPTWWRFTDYSEKPPKISSSVA